MNVRGQYAFFKLGQYAFFKFRCNLKIVGAIGVIKGEQILEQI